MLSVGAEVYLTHVASGRICKLYLCQAIRRGVLEDRAFAGLSGDPNEG